MAQAPPSYQKVTEVPRSPLVVRLQVWHFSRGGRCPAYNEGLADTFSREGMQDWVARPVHDPEYDSASARDDFVPVEVTRLPIPLLNSLAVANFDRYPARLTSKT